MAKQHSQTDTGYVVGVFRHEMEASYAIDKLIDRGFEASPIPTDQARRYRSDLQAEEIVVAVSCGDRCDIARSMLTDYGASRVASASPPPGQAVMVRGTGAMPILAPRDTQRVIDIDGLLEVKEGPYVEPDVVDLPLID